MTASLDSRSCHGMPMRAYSQMSFFHSSSFQAADAMSKRSTFGYPSINHRPKVTCGGSMERSNGFPAHIRTPEFVSLSSYANRRNTHTLVPRFLHPDSFAHVIFQHADAHFASPTFNPGFLCPNCHTQILIPGSCAHILTPRKGTLNG